MLGNEISTVEYKTRYENKDVSCILAQMLAEESFGKEYKLGYKSPTLITRFVGRADEMIKKLSKHKLKLIYKED